MDNEKMEGKSLLESKESDNGRKNMSTDFNGRKNMSTDFNSNLARFFGCLSKNNNVVYCIGNYLIKDKEAIIKDINMSSKEKEILNAIESLQAFTIDEVQVTMVDAQTKKGYVVINNLIDIPLINTSNIGTDYFFDRSEALKEWSRRNEIELKVAELVTKTGTKAIEYLKRVTEKGLH